LRRIAKENAMSTDYRTLKKVSAQELFDGCLEEYGVREHINADTTTNNWRCLTDGNNYLWVSIRDDGFVGAITRFRPGGAPGKTLRAIAEAFDSDIVSEYEPQFWGFDTQEEWGAAWEQWAREDEEKFYLEILKYLQGEASDIRPGTIGMIKAEIAKKLTDNEPALLLLTNKDKLRREIDTIYDREHAVRVSLGPADIAAAEMLITHEDDLPRA
jgi:hypothetical protein